MLIKWPSGRGHFWPNDLTLNKLEPLEMKQRGLQCIIRKPGQRVWMGNSIRKKNTT